MDGAAAASAGLVRPHLIGLPVYKMTGSGNDFVMLDGRVTEPEEWSPADVAAACARGTGVGADGLVFVLPGSGPRTVRMIYYNSDGSHADMCGNAALCSTRLAAYLDIAPAGGMTLETDAGVYESRCAAEPDRAELHLAPVAAPAQVPGLRLTTGESPAALGVVGVPHLVVVVPEVSDIDLQARGRALRTDPSLGAPGANVNFISGSHKRWRMRTYERGIEGETLACGTGAVAAGCALDEWGYGTFPFTIVCSSGRELEIRARKESDGRYGDIWLIGEARLVFRGVLA